MAEKISILGLDKAVEEKLGSFIHTITDANGKEWEIEYKQKFSKDGIANVIMDFAKFVQSTNGSSIDEATLTSYMYVLLLKEFTDLSDVISNDLERQLSVLRKLIELDMFESLMEAFPTDEVKRVVDAMQEATKKINQNMDIYTKAINNINLDNPEVSMIKG